MNDSAAHKIAEMKWRSYLDDQEREVAFVAEKLNNGLPALGAGYRAALFLRHYLVNGRAVDGTAVVGFINNGENDVYRSHAWYEYGGLKTDLAISRLEGDQAGPLVIQGHEFKPGKTWTYHKSRPAGSRIGVFEMTARADDRETIEQAEELHMQMLEISRNLADIRRYLDQAPDGVDYEALANMID